MPVDRIEIRDPSAYEAVDVIASSVLKEPHKRYGTWMKKLAAIVHRFYETKGNWQGLWTIATRVFGLAYHGHTLEVCKAMASALATEMNVDPGVAEDLASQIVAALSDIVGERRATGKAPTVAEE